MEIQFDDPTEVPESQHYTVTIYKDFYTTEIHHVGSLVEVHKVIGKTPDYLLHRQNITREPYNYNVWTKKYYFQLAQRW